MLTLPAGSTSRRELAAVETNVVLHCCASPVQVRTNSFDFHTRLVYFLCCGIEQYMPLESVLLLCCSGHSIMLSCVCRSKPRAIGGSNGQSSASYPQYPFTLIAVTDDSKYAGIWGHQDGDVEKHSVVQVQFLVDGKWSAAEMFISFKVLPFDTVRVAFVTESRPTRVKFTNSNEDGWGFKALALHVGTAETETETETEIPVPPRWKGGEPGGWVKAGENKNADLAIPPVDNTQPPGESISPKPENTPDAAAGLVLRSEVEVGLTNWPYRLLLQQDGNLVLYEEGKVGVRWASNTARKGQGPFELFLQGDGNLVVYDNSRRATWASGSRGHNCVLRLQSDGNLVIIADNGHGHPTWSTNTVSKFTKPWDQSPWAAASPTPVRNKPEAKVDELICELTTAPYRLVLQQDGNLVMYQDIPVQGMGNVRWTTNTAGNGQAPFKLLLQGDGNLVLYDKYATPIWSSRSAGRGGRVVKMQGDGNLVMYDADGRSVWATNTAPVDCKVNAWQTRGPCPVPCGGEGKAEQRRRVTQSPRYGGAPCPPLQKRGDCNTQACPPGHPALAGYERGVCNDGYYDKQKGNTLRRDCGATCPGGSGLTDSGCNCACLPWDKPPSYEMKAPTTTPPPAVDCQVGPWSKPGPCSKRCGGGRKEQYRLVTRKPSGAGAPCPRQTQLSDCNTQSCTPTPHLVHVGNGGWRSKYHAGSSVKTVNAPGVTKCDKNAADKKDRGGTRDRACYRCDDKDTFDVTVPQPGVVSVRRTDESHGWQMDLKFTCYSGGPV